MNDFIQQGWQCPICKRVYSPSTPCCFTCGGESITTTSTDGFVTEDDYVYNKKKHRYEYKYVPVRNPPNFTSISTGYAQFTAEEVEKEADNDQNRQSSSGSDTSD